MTLVEVLVVLAVIGILTALMLPGLGRVRERMREAACLGHFRQISVGLKLYQADNQGFHPVGATLSSAPGALVPPGTPNDRIWDFTSAMGGKDVTEVLPMLPPAKARPLSRYVADPRAFRCPVDGGLDYRAGGGPHWKSLWDSFGCSYRYNGPGGAGDGVYRTRIGGKDDSWLAEASRFIVFYEPPAKRQSWRGQGFFVYWHRSHPPKTVHGTGVRVADGRLVSPILFADGHAEIVDFTDDGALGLNSSRWLWYQPE